MYNICNMANNSTPSIVGRADMGTKPKVTKLKL